jgi:hypothetical protein
MSLIALVLSGFLTVAYVRNPFLANRSDVSNPIPLELPVTTAVFSSAIYFSTILKDVFAILISGASIWLCDLKEALSNSLKNSTAFSM